MTHDVPVLELRYESAGGTTSTLEVTEEHPFWVRNTGWTAASDLLPGDELFTSRGGWLRVTGGTWLATTRTVYNLEVGGAHTYFVASADGGEGVWVHNSCVDELIEQLKNTPFTPTQSAKRMSWSKIDQYANDMANGVFDWSRSVGINRIKIDSAGRVLDGHHRVVAATKAGVAIPESAIYRSARPNLRPGYDWSQTLGR